MEGSVGWCDGVVEVLAIDRKPGNGRVPGTMTCIIRALYCAKAAIIASSLTRLGQ